MSKTSKLIEELKRLRAAWFESEFEYYRRMHEIELKEEAVWRKDFVTFDALIAQEELDAMGRYRSFVEACGVFGEDRVRVIGVAAAIVAARVSSKPDREKIAAHFETSRRENGKPLSDRQAKQIAERMSSEAKKSGYEKRAEQREMRETSLYEENVELKKRVRLLEKENRELREQLTRASGTSPRRRSEVRRPV